MSRLVAMLLLALSGCAVAPAPSGDSSELAQAQLDGVVLHYQERGRGEPVVFVHGALGDYREWAPVAGLLADRYRTIVYSRRYNFPNGNPMAADHSALTEAADLAALIRKLRLAPAHVVGASYGAYTALLLALHEPALVRSLTLMEPPLIRWLPDIPGGAPLFHDFYDGTWRPAGEAFRRGDPTRAMRVAFDFFIGPGGFDRLPPRERADIMGNVREFEALTTSSDAFPPITREEVRGLPVPVLLLSGGRTYPMLKLTDAELERQLRHGRRIVIPDGTHEACSEQPSTCAAAIRAFLGGLPR